MCIYIYTYIYIQIVSFAFCWNCLGLWKSGFHPALIPWIRMGVYWIGDINFKNDLFILSINYRYINNNTVQIIYYIIFIQHLHSSPVYLAVYLAVYLEWGHGSIPWRRRWANGTRDVLQPISIKGNTRLRPKNSGQMELFQCQLPRQYVVLQEFMHSTYKRDSK